MTSALQGKIEQLRRAHDAGLIDQGTFDAAVAALSAQLTGSGAIAQGQDTLAVGAGGVGISGDNHGPINLGVLIQQGTKPGASEPELRRAYLARILRQANQLPLSVGDGANAPLQLSAVYTALLTTRSEQDQLRDPAPSHRAAPDRDARRLSALEALDAERQLVLLGGPGSGKSTFVNFVALAMAGELLHDPSGPNLATLTRPPPGAERDDKSPEPQRWTHGPLLPVLITLRDLAHQLPEAGKATNAQTVWKFIHAQLEKAALGDYGPHLHKALMEHGGLILLDGLDEVSLAPTRRQQIKQAVQDFAASFGRCRFLVTSRTYAYQKQEWKLDGFAQAQLQAFTPEQITGFVDAWYAHMVQLQRLTAANAGHRAGVLKQAVERNARLRGLAERPLLLTLIAQLQTERQGSLPEKPEELYDKAVEMLLDRWERTKVSIDDNGKEFVEPSVGEYLKADRDAIRRQLNRLAFEAHQDQEAQTDTADIPQGKILQALQRASGDREPNLTLLQRYLSQRAGLLLEHGSEMYQFPHRSFQEYLAACHLTDDDFPNKLAQLACGDPSRWREVALLAAAKSGRGSSLNVWTLAETLCPPTPGADADAASQWGALLAGRVLADCADLAHVAPRDVPKQERVRDRQCTILSGLCLPGTERALAGRTLAVLGDPRPEVMQLDAMQFCYVPAGPFVMGGEYFDDEKPQHTVGLDYPYFIARFPVTMAQWLGLADPSESAPDRETPARVNDPVTGMSWHEARGFCVRLSEHWRGRLPQGFTVMLPSEAEWEKAARGGLRIPAQARYFGLTELSAALRNDREQRDNPQPRRDYPWGDEFDGEASNVELVVGQTSAVGCWPRGTSPYGCEDLSGNVWEWTRSLWGADWQRPDFHYPYGINDALRENLDAGDDIRRVLRGGSWILHRLLARCASRDRLHPHLRNCNVGFRVVLRPSPVKRSDL
ncbi:MAG: SUMF1/EgtB/PvdO family nonheme iron enzyme [Rhodanobacteraceae bacterium]|nr:SUMF1/EgtB/PvdO family nonheme iron enzyme [Rhodanobacteraceae bacterium]